MQIGKRVHSRALKHFLGHAADAGNDAHGQRLEKCDFIALGNQSEPIGLPEIAGQLCQKLVRRDADAGGEAAFGLDLRLQVFRDWDRCVQIFDVR